MRWKSAEEIRLALGKAEKVGMFACDL